MDWKKINHIAFDADDTLWSLEAQFWEIERRFLALLAPYGSADALAEKLVAVERGNHPVYGYGVKSFTLSMIETALACSGGRIPAEDVGRILDFGKTLLNAFDRLEVLEYSAKALIAARDIGPLVKITEPEVQAIREAFHMDD